MPPSTGIVAPVMKSRPLGREKRGDVGDIGQLSQSAVAEILKIIDSSSCDEVIVETGDVKLVVRRNTAPGYVAPAAERRRTRAGNYGSAALQCDDSATGNDWASHEAVHDHQLRMRRACGADRRGDRGSGGIRTYAVCHRAGELTCFASAVNSADRPAQAISPARALVETQPPSTFNSAPVM